MTYVTYSEKAFLQLMAKRLLRFAREAASRGETYHDVAPLAPLACGAMAKYRFEGVPGGYAPVVTLRGPPTLAPNQLKEIATELLEGPAILRAADGDDLEYVREDAGALFSG